MSYLNPPSNRTPRLAALHPDALTPIALAVALLLVAHPIQATPLALAQVPAGNGGREPAPNLLISVDDSGSMGSTGIASLKTALNTAFSQAAVADDSIRLGFQAMWLCRGFMATPYKNTSATYTCPDTRVKPFSDTHRTNFTNWVSKLAPASGTPSHSMMLNAHAHLSDLTYDIYRDDPASTTSTAQACRKSFHIFMTDGGWKDLGNHQGATSINGTTISSANMGLPGNADGTAQTLPDGTVYDPYGTTATPTTAHTKIYRDSYDPVANDGRSDTDRAKRGTVSTLADWAFLMWATDYRPALDNKVRPIIRQAGPVDVGTSSTPYEIPEYWNPKNNPMTWQGLTTYTIGFNSAANMPTTRRSWKHYTGALASEATETITMPKWGGNTWTGDFAAMIRGDSGLSWPNPLRGHPRNTVSNSWTYEYDTSLQTDGANSTNNGGGADFGKIYDLWHPAINGRGRYVPATSTAELTNAFAEIVNQVIADSSSPLSSVASNTQTITSGTRIYTAGYDAVKWNGYVQSRALGTGYSVATAPEWDTALMLDNVTPASRVILTQNDSGGTAFEWGNLSVAQQAAIQGPDSATVGQDRVAYLRGDRTKEEASGGTFRTRAKRLGDIVNSNLWVVGKPDIGYAKDGYTAFRAAQSSRPTMIYVGANDGMLHGFAASDGSEKLAYVPKGVYNNLAAYTSTGYTHRYMVDGHPFSGDIKDGSTWKTMLVGTLAGGGKGYFVLNITSPSSWSSSAASSTVVLDRTDDSDPDIGHMYGEPTLDATNNARVVQITKLNNGRWALLMGNGVNSTDEKAVLLIQYLDGAKELNKIVLDGTGGNGNGLSNPQVIDIDGNGTADVVYAGDQRGNLWKVDISSTTATNWGSYYLLGATPDPLFVAKDTSGTRQPITTAPQWATHPLKGLLLSFGTGREMTLTDRTTSSNQTLYSVWDNGDFKPKATPMMTDGSVVSNGRADLVPQTLSGTLTIGGRVYGKTSTNNVVYTGTTPKRGWLMEWPNAGERTINNGGMLSERLLFMRSRIPASGSQESAITETCTPSASSAREFYTVLDIVTGKPPVKPVFDTDGGGFTGSEEAGVSRWEVGREDRLLIKTGRPGELVSISAKSKGTESSCTGNDCSPGLKPSTNLVEIGWRQLQ